MRYAVQLRGTQRSARVHTERSRLQHILPISSMTIPASATHTLTTPECLSILAGAAEAAVDMDAKLDIGQVDLDVFDSCDRALDEEADLQRELMCTLLLP